MLGSSFRDGHSSATGLPFACGGLWGALWASAPAAAAWGHGCPPRQLLVLRPAIRQMRFITASWEPPCSAALLSVEREGATPAGEQQRSLPVSAGRAAWLRGVIRRARLWGARSFRHGAWTSAHAETPAFLRLQDGATRAERPWRGAHRREEKVEPPHGDPGGSASAGDKIGGGGSKG